MGFFPNTVAAALSGRVVRASTLVFLDFEDEPMRLWLGFGMLSAGGHLWSGLGEFGAVSGIESPIGGTAPETTLTLSGVKPEQVLIALDAEGRVKGRAAIIYMQFFDENWQVLDQPYAIMSGTMDQMTISAPDMETRRIEVSVEWLFTRRSIPPFGFLSDHDQKSLYPGDRGVEQVVLMQNKSTTWPIV